MQTIELSPSDAYYTQSSRIVAAISNGESLERFVPSPLVEGLYATYYLPFTDVLYEVRLKANGTYLILRGTDEYTSPGALWAYEFHDRKKVPDLHREPCFICMPGLTVLSDQWCVSGATEVAWYRGVRIKYDDSFLESRGGSQYPLSVRYAELPPSVAKGPGG